MKEFLILVDEQDTELGKIEKLEAHEQGLLHRAFSVFIFNTRGELLLQQRADSKYHSAGLWTNTCCSHPNFGEEISDAIERRLMEEMGLTCKTSFGFKFIYKVEFSNGLTEHELDHVYFGMTDEPAIPNPNEVKNVKYLSLTELKNEIDIHPEFYTEWMKLCFHKVCEYANKNNLSKI